MSSINNPLNQTFRQHEITLLIQDNEQRKSLCFLEKNVEGNYDKKILCIDGKEKTIKELKILKVHNQYSFGTESKITIFNLEDRLYNNLKVIYSFANSAYSNTSCKVTAENNLNFKVIKLFDIDNPNDNYRDFNEFIRQVESLKMIAKLNVISREVRKDPKNIWGVIKSFV